MTKGFAAVADDIELLKDDVSQLKHDVGHLPTRSDMGTRIDHATRSLASELSSIRKDLEHLTDKVDNLGGLPKEIDHALERIAKIEKHLGLNQEIAA